MSNKHTTGQWIASPESGSNEWGVDAGMWGICICADAPGDGTPEANARLIAAAPDLLDSLILAERKLSAYVGVCTGDKELNDAVLPRARAAISKATGNN